MSTGLLLILLNVLSLGADAPPPWWEAPVAESLARAPERRPAWEAMLHALPPEQRAGAAYLMADLPERDLQALDPQQLARNIELAYQARAEAPWGKDLPEAVFLDAVLPHISATEPRDAMRAEFHDKYSKLVADCRTPGEAALKLNAALFNDYKVQYNTRRIRTDQSSKETIAQGMATCTGLSIMLVEACRAVGVPARVAGISAWPGRGGNHTWTEVWDGDAWHFVGSAEPDPNGLDHAWFAGEAATAIASVPQNAVYAVTYRKTGEYFPVVWAPRAKVNAENVTLRYTKGVSHAPRAPRLMVEVKDGADRVEAEVTVFDLATGEPTLAGKSYGPQADINRHLLTDAHSGQQFLVIARYAGAASARCGIVQAGDTLVKLDLKAGETEETRARLAALVADRFSDDEEKRSVARRLLAELPWNAEARAAAIQAWRNSPRHAELKQEYDAKVVKTKDRTSPYLFREVGEKPKNGWGLVIAMHGGGGAPKAVNDSQWQGMFEKYYKDHPEVGGYVYLALRAPNDEWDGFYDDAICPLVQRLIEQFVLFHDVDPNRVVTLGASHGGYGAFVIGPKIPDRFMAVHASASAPTPGRTRGENLRNTHFTFMVGEKDTAYGRADRCQEFAKLFDELRQQYGGFAGGFEWKPGVGHFVPDRDHLAKLLVLPPRDAWPKRLIWTLSDSMLKDFYYVENAHPRAEERVDVTVKDNTILVDSNAEGPLALRLDEKLVDLTKPVTIERVGGATVSVTPTPNVEAYCRSLETLADPDLAAPCRVEVPAGPVQHGFLATGQATYIVDSKGQRTWTSTFPSRDGWVLPGGNVLLAVTRGGEYPGGGVVEVEPNGKVVFSFKGSQSEVNTAQKLPDGTYLLTEAGDNPRILEVDKDGKTVREVKIQAQTKDHHLQTRMTRKLPNGNYLVPQLLDRVVREYTPAGEVVWEVKTPNMPFTAIRLENGNTLIGCTLGDLVIEVNPKGETVWSLSNADLPEKMINDACGVQRLPNGNTVVTSHHASGDDVRLTEVTPDKKVVWTHRDPKAPGIHHFQILETNGIPLSNNTMR